MVMFTTVLAAADTVAPIIRNNLISGNDVLVPIHAILIRTMWHVRLFRSTFLSIAHRTPILWIGATAMTLIP